MTTTSAVEVSTAAPPLRPGASPATVLSYLLPEDRPTFVEEYEAALEDARRTLELTRVEYVVEQWRRIALLQADPERFRRTVRRAAEIMTGGPIPEDEPFEVTRVKAGM